jgi:molecular chaperone HscC
MTILGIDLGTTNSLCTIFTAGEPLLIPNVHGEYITPSAIAVNEKSEIIIGKAALEYSLANKYPAIKSFKRYMGSNKVFQLGKEQYRAEELSALILKNLKKDAEIYLQKEITSAIISVPAYFNNKQRQATKTAAELAGLQVIRLINEPTAAALSYGIKSNIEETKYLIFDLGGGTFDVTIMELFNGILEVRASAGDNFLGGDDFTEIIVEDFYKHNKISEHEIKQEMHKSLVQQAENCKIYLNQSKNYTKEYEISISYRNQEYSHQYNLAQLEDIFQPLIERLIQPIKRSLNDSKLKPADLDAIVFVGGASKIPMLSKICTKMFMKLPFIYHNPQHVVALGVAVMAGMAENNEQLEEFVLTDVCPYTLGTSYFLVENEQTGHGSIEYMPIIDRNVTLPTSKVQYFQTSASFQETIKVEVYQGESRILNNNIKIGEFSIDLEPMKELQDIDIRYTYDINGILEVEVTAHQSNLSQSFVIKESCGNMSDEEVQKSLNKFKTLKIHPRDQDINIALLANAERMYEEYVGDARFAIALEIRRFETAIDNDHTNEIQIARTRLANLLKELEMVYE